MDKYWQTDNPEVFLVGGRKFAIKKRGRAQATQLAHLNQWLKLHIAPLTGKLKEQDSAAGVEMFLSMADELSVDAQMELAQTLLGEKDVEGVAVDQAFLDEHYDIDWVTDALSIAARGGAVANILNSFFTNIG